MLQFSVSFLPIFLFQFVQLNCATNDVRYVSPLAFRRVAIVYNSPFELSLFSAAKDGDLQKFQEIIASNRPIDVSVLEKAFILASNTNNHAVVRAILCEQVLNVNTIQQVLLYAARKNLGETVAEILRSGSYDPADLSPTFSAALTHNSVSVVKAFLQYPKFSYPDANRARAIELCKARKFFEMEKLLNIPRDQLLAIDEGTCTIF